MLLQVRKYINDLWHNSHISQENYRCFIIFKYIALFCFTVHFIFIFLFALLKADRLVFLNIFSCGIYMTAFWLNRKEKQVLVFLMCSLEIILHAFIVSFYLGWNSGFHYYILLLVPATFFLPLLKSYTKMFFVFILGILYISINHFFLHSTPLYSVDQYVTIRLDTFNIIVTITALAFLSYTYNIAANSVENILKKANSELEILAMTDPLTKLLNRRTMMEKIENEIVKSKGNYEYFVLVICDIDNFKGINDSYGHQCGDFVLSAVTEIMRNSVRKQDHIARWGGEEFLILLPGTNIHGGRVVAEKIRETVSSYSFYYNENNIAVTMTFGVSEYSNKTDIAECIARADRALYKGKNSGKNCIIEI